MPTKAELEATLEAEREMHRVNRDVCREFVDRARRAEVALRVIVNYFESLAICPVSDPPVFVGDCECGRWGHDDSDFDYQFFLQKINEIIKCEGVKL